MARHIASIQGLKIPNGQSVSQAFSTLIDKYFGAAQSALGLAVGLIIYAPASLPEVVTVYVQWRGAGNTWYPLNSSGGATFTLAAGQATIIPSGFADMRLQSTGNVAADRNFVVDLQEDMA